MARGGGLVSRGDGEIWSQYDKFLVNVRGAERVCFRYIRAAKQRAHGASGGVVSSREAK